MDKKLFLSTLLVIAIMLVTAQTPLLFNYQTVVRDANGIILANEEISVTIEILKDEPSGEVIFSESHSVTTSPQGVVNLQIGSNNDLNTVSWESSTHYLRVKINDIEVGTSQILSVPYAIHAKTAENLSEEIVEQDPVFSAWDKSSGIVLTESQISDLQHYITEENDPSFTVNFDFSNAEANDLLRFDGSKWVKFTPEYLTSFTETDPSFASWDKSTGIEIVESQITDFKEYLLSEVDPQVSANFDFSESQEGDLLMFNGEKWVKFSPNYLTEFTESQNLADVISAGNDAGNNQIKNVANPTDNQDAATKLYVDNSSMPAGTEPGEIMYWDGSQWLPIAPGTHGEFLTFCDGKPTWGYCLAKLTTTEITNNIGSNAVSGGTITNMGGSPIIQKGVCWSTNPEPTIHDSFTNDGQGSEIFTSNITGLTSGVLYYVRAYAINSGGVSYGNEVTCTTTITLPSVSTIEVFDVMALDAKYRIEVENTGGAAIVAGVCWSTSPNPTTTDSKTEDVTETGSFTSSITGLDVSTTYYVRAYATNSMGTVYGEEYSFTTQSGVPGIYSGNVFNITISSAQLEIFIEEDGGSEITLRGTCWSTDPNPTTGNFKTEDGAGIDWYTSNMSGLEINTTYFVKAYATNEVGTFYGEEYSFTTLDGIPTINSNNVSNIKTSSAQMYSCIDDGGGSEIIQKGTCWGTDPNPTTDNFKTEEGPGTDCYTSNITDLNITTTYYARAYAINSIGTFYGDESSFTTPDGVVTLYTNSASQIKATSASSGGYIHIDGGSTISERGVCWSTSANPTIDDTFTVSEESNSYYTCNLSNLTPSTKYYIRAYIINEYGTFYGDEYSFTTRNGIPTLNTTFISNITLTSSETRTNISDDGGATITQRGVCWSTSENPTIDDSKTLNGSGSGIFTSTLTNLSAGTNYYVRAYVVSNLGVSYSNEINFTSADGTPRLGQSTLSNITSTGAECISNIEEDYGSPVTARGICWSTSTNPTISDNITQDGAGLGEFSSTISGLTEWTGYYVRAYATNDYGTGYGEEVHFMASNPVSDFEGNSYPTVKIDDQIWMAENLKVTVLNDGSAISSVNSEANYKWYDDNVANKDLYGALYNGYAAITPNLCPTGWHVPSNAEWTALADYLGGASVAGGKLKSTSTDPDSHPRWDSPNTGATNESLFYGLPGGYFEMFMFFSKGSTGEWWTSTIKNDMIITEYWTRVLSSGSNSLGSSAGTLDGMPENHSVRCIKD